MLEIAWLICNKLTQLLFANCWRAYKVWSASIVAGVFSLRNCSWLVNRSSSFCSPKDVLGEQHAISSLTPVTMSWPSSGPESCVIWLWKRPTSGWGSFWESSSFDPWLVLNALRDGSGVVPEWPCSSGFIRTPSRRANAPSMLFFVLLNSFDNLFVTLPSISSETSVI